MKCTYCKDTGKYRKPKNEQEFERIIDVEMDKGYFVNYETAAEIAYSKVGYDIVDCPYCDAKKKP